VKFIIDNWYLILIALASGVMLLLPLVRGAGGGSLTAAQAVQLINRQKAVVIDVCEPEEYAAAHANGARNPAAMATPIGTSLANMQRISPRPWSLALVFP